MQDNPVSAAGPESSGTERRYRDIVESQTELICRFLPDGTLTFINQAYCRQLEVERDQILGDSIFKYLSETRLEGLKTVLESLSVEHPIQVTEHALSLDNGPTTWQSWTDQGIFDKQGKLVEVQSVGHNITDRKLTELAAAQRARELSALQAATATLLSTLEIETLLGQILDAALSAIPKARRAMIHLIARDTGKLEMRATLGYTDTDPRIRKVSLTESKGYVVRAVREKIPLIIQDLAIDEPVAGDENEENDRRSVIVAPLILDEEVLGALSLASADLGAFRQSDLDLLASFAVTATAAIRNAQLHAEVKTLAITDLVTGVYNRRGFYEVGGREIERALRYSRQLTAIMLDIDQFKKVNDQYGHLVGDQVLRNVAESCKWNIRNKVDVLGRFGGDEFAILLPESNMFTATSVAERLRLRVSQAATMVGGASLFVTISLGIAKLTPDIKELDGLLRRADTALYLAKQEGRNRVAIG